MHRTRARSRGGAAGTLADAITLSFDPGYTDPGVLILSNGNLTLNNDNYYGNSFATVAKNSGQWYWEIVVDTVGVAGNVMIGVGERSDTDLIPFTYVAGYTPTSYVYVAHATKVNAGSETSYGAALFDTDVVGVALDLEAGTLEFFKNNVSQGVAFTGISGSLSPVVGFLASNTNQVTAHFAAADLVYAPPTGFVALDEGWVDLSAGQRLDIDFILDTSTLG